MVLAQRFVLERDLFHQAVDTVAKRYKFIFNARVFLSDSFEFLRDTLTAKVLVEVCETHLQLQPVVVIELRANRREVNVIKSALFEVKTKELAHALSHLLRHLAKHARHLLAFPRKCRDVLGE